MRIVIPDDYQDAVRHLNCFAKLSEYEVIIYNDTVKDVDTLAERMADADALVLIRERTAITEALLQRLPNLRVIAQTGRGIPHIDVEACTRQGVAVATGTGSPDAPAELTWALLMAAMRRLPTEIAAMRAGRWQTTMGVSLRGRTLGILGYGNIGSIVASYGWVFGMSVLVWGREGSRRRAKADQFKVAFDQRDLFERSDVLSIHLKLTPETRGSVTYDDLMSMKPDSLLMNTSRAELIEPDALVKALRAGRPGFAALDVYESEPVIDHPLLHMDNVVCTPHIGYVEKETYENYFRLAFDQLLAFFAGEPAGLANPEVLTQSR